MVCYRVSFTFTCSSNLSSYVTQNSFQHAISRFIGMSVYWDHTKTTNTLFSKCRRWCKEPALSSLPLQHPALNYNSLLRPEVYENFTFLSLATVSAGGDYNEKLNGLYSSPNILRVIKSRRMRWAGHVARMGEERPLGRPRRRWVDNIRMDLQEVGCGYMDWIGLAHDRDRWRTLVSALMNLRVPWNAGKFLTSCKPVSFSRRILHHGVSK